MLLKKSQAQTKKSSTLAVGDEGAIADVDENVVQELISQVHMNLTKRPHLHVPIQSVPYFSMKGPVFRGTSSLNIFCMWSPKNKLNRNRGAQPRATCAARVTPPGHGGDDVLHFDPSKKQSDHKRNDARSDNAAFTDPQRAVDKDKEESAHLVLHCDAELPGTNGAVDTGHDQRGGQGKGSRGDNPTADWRTTNGEGDAHLCPGVQASPSVRQAWEGTSVTASFRVEMADRVQVDESPERRAVSASPTWRQQRRTLHRRGMHRQKFIRHVSILLRGDLLRKAVRRGHMARQWLDELPKSEKEQKEDVAKLMALTN